MARPAVEGVSGEAVDGEHTRVGPGGQIQLQHFIRCNDGSLDWIWVLMGGGDPANPASFVPQVTPQDLLPGAFARAREQLPTPVPRVAPADTDSEGFAYVQAETFYWVDTAAGQWAPVSATASLAALSLTVTVTPEHLLVDPGDGTGTITCAGAPPPFPAGGDPDTFAGCGHIYRDSSAMAANGATFPVTVTIGWHATWQASNGESGDLGMLTTTSEPRQLPVAEVQALLVEG